MRGAATRTVNTKIIPLVAEIMIRPIATGTKMDLTLERMTPAPAPRTTTMAAAPTTTRITAFLEVTRGRISSAIAKHTRRVIGKDIKTYGRATRNVATTTMTIMAIATVI